MNQSIWEQIAGINQVLLPLRMAETTAALGLIDVVEMRSKIRSNLEGLRVAVSEHYSERDAYFVLFPLMAHCDEIVKMRLLDAKRKEWPPLQEELYQIADAGDLFYELLDNSLSRPETLPLVFDVYYFVLNDGFHGRYAGNPDRIADYLQKLGKRIRLEPLDEPKPEQMQHSSVFFRIPSYFYYLGTFVLLVLFYFFLTALASSWQPS